MQLTEKQQAIYDYIEQYLIENHNTPPIRTICTKFNFSLKAGYDHLRALTRKGKIISGQNGRYRLQKAILIE